MNTPETHTTRDYREGTGSIADLVFTVVDTSGLEPTAHAGSLLGRAALLTAGVLKRADAALLLLDAKWARAAACGGR